MIEKPKGRFVDRQDNDLPDSFEKLIEKYGLENVWEYIEKYWNDVESLTTNVSQALTDISSLESDVEELQANTPIDSLDSTSTTRPLSANQGKVLDEKTDLKITTGVEVATNEYIDNNRVYVKRIDIGTLPNATSKDVSTGLSTSQVSIERLQGKATRSSDNAFYPLPFAHPTAQNAISCLCRDNDGTIDIRIQTGIDRSTASGYIDVYYTK